MHEQVEFIKGTCFEKSISEKDICTVKNVDYNGFSYDVMCSCHVIITVHINTSMLKCCLKRGDSKLGILQKIINYASRLVH